MGQALVPAPLLSTSNPERHAARGGGLALHLIYLNIFKLLFNYTIHQSLPGKGC